MTEEVKKTDFYLRLNAESDMPTVLSAFYQQEEFISHTESYAIDAVGILYESTGTTLTDEEGIEYAEKAPLDGWHINIRLSGDSMRETVEALDATYGVVPASPQRTWL